MGRRNREIKSEAIIEARRLDKEWNTAIYARLSSENNGLEDDRSLMNQVDYVKQYLMERPNLKLIDIYMDNGHTGTNFERPEFLRLMEDIKEGKIDCIVVKDLSRFGRNYLEAGYYIEKIFPFLNVRFIAINDQLDSMDERTKNAITLPIKNLVNEMYSKDISKKITATMRMKEKKGEILYGHPAYGYARDPKNPFHYIVDEEVQPYVYMLFAWAKMGMLPGRIATRMAEIKAPTPSEIWDSRNMWHCDYKYGKGIWEPTTVKGILRNPIYVGDTVYNRSRQSIIHGIEPMRQPKEDWYVIPNTHEGYLTREEFEAINRRMDETCKKEIKQRENYAQIKKENPDVLDGLFFCADCGRKMFYYREIKKKKIRFCEYHCLSTNYHYKGMCERNPINDRLIRTIVLDQIKLQVSAACKYGEVTQQLLKDEKFKSKEEVLKNRIAELKEEMDVVTSKRGRLYADFAEGVLTEEDYIDIKAKYDGRFKALSVSIIETEKELENIESVLHPEQEVKNLLEKFNGEDKLTYEMAHAFIKRIEMDKHGAVSITFNCRDYISELAELEASS